ncbi:methyl-accepting chemotaxis protein [Agrobacterium albertimagni AOL15]|uniref:Methyl-accepting chemotaxis protein n=1 Tax=Agrobacterium albertimagni AOL15 TaxID=1156935 RepID=K2QUC5_9HYPH|nr:methyl-accepting chemotaxis protein [Agrobacterium albertimagni]EKF58732.1 methyl-accepting chemotaxis protein [Agrobacterium albertimagni AOL15]
MQFFSRFGITKTITATTVLILIAALGAVAWVISGSIETRIQQQAIAGQDASLRTAATIIERDLPGTQITWAQDGNVSRIVMESIPAEFTEHGMIDVIGRMTGQTATIFAWDAERKDFWRRTTNIIKPDGNRAVGTALGQTGAVYPYAVKGEVYRGEAVILETPYYTIYQPIFSPAGDVLGILYAGVRKADINSIATEMTYAIGTTALIVLLIAATLIALLVRRIVGSLPRLTAVADRLASGQLETEVPDQHLRNEIGALARAINVFRESAIQKIEIERRAADAAAQGEQERAEREVAKAEDSRLVQEAVDALADGLTCLSDGDLTVRIDRAFIGNLDRLRVDFNASVEKLSSTLAEIRTETSGIEASSAEMRSATDDLSKRTEQQAASLEETSAALEEITSTVRGSSAKADEAATMATKARQSTETSSKVVSDAIEAMSRIEQASSEISKIINVIDEIAFQTNLLALNAGVEAARAGEAGKGFAVVAQEVRELAQRSANAAKDIKALINKSGEAVAGGVSLVQQTGSALTEISSQVAVINDHISSIASAAREQSTALNEINGSVNHMDQFTQKNAAMVEEATAVTHRLADSARNLGGLVAQFRVAGGAVSSNRAPTPSHAAPAPTARPAARPAAAQAETRPVASPARRMVGNLAKAFGGGSTAAAASQDNWEEF